jgi:hypothetical protein
MPLQYPTLMKFYSKVDEVPGIKEYLTGGSQLDRMYYLRPVVESGDPLLNHVTNNMEKDTAQQLIELQQQVQVSTRGAQFGC